MRTTTACSWCHTMNDAEQRDCINCGHDAHVPRSQCACASCTHQGIRQVTRDSARSLVAKRAAVGIVPGPDRKVDKIDHVAAGIALQYIVYHNLTNWPDQYVLRCFSIHDGPPMLPSVLPLIVHADLAKVREVIPSGYVNLGRSGLDAACVVEVWV